MAKVRILVFLSTILVVAILGTVASFYARGYKFDFKTLRFTPNGILVVNSEPNGAQIYINGSLKTATNATVSIAPGTYQVEVKKDGFLTWSKTLTIQKEVVTEVDASLFPAAPSLSAMTFAGVISPVASADAAKVAYAVPQTKETIGSPAGIDKAGLWVSEVVTLPIGFNREPKRITDGDLTNAVWVWSPDAKEILLTINPVVNEPVAKTKTQKPAVAKVSGPTYLLDVTEFLPQTQLKALTAVEISQIESRWREKEKKKLDSQLANLPLQIQDVFKNHAKDISFSPDETKILYTASDSATIATGLIKELPGASTQKQTRDIQKDKKYVFDIKEDRNFEIADSTEITYWLPTSRHIIMPQKDKIIIAEYDGTNRQTVYSGSYLYPHAYPYSNSSKLMILTNLGSVDSLPNLYTLNLK